MVRPIDKCISRIPAQPDSTRIRPIQMKEQDNPVIQQAGPESQLQAANIQIDESTVQEGMKVKGWASQGTPHTGCRSTSRPRSISRCLQKNR